MIPHWFKFQRNLLTTAQAMSAGTDAVLIYLDACGLCFDAESVDGEIPTSQIASVGRTLLAHDGWTKDRVAAGVEAARLHGLLLPGEQNGALVVRDWADFIRPPVEGRGRTAKWRSKERDDDPVTGVTDGPSPRREEKTREDKRTTTTTRARAREPQVGGGGGVSDLTPEQRDVERSLMKAGVFVLSEASRNELACLIVTRGRNAQDVDDLIVHARGKKGIEDPARWLATVLQDSDAMAGALEEAQRAARGGAGSGLYWDGPVPGRGDAGTCLDPADHGIKRCDQCERDEFGVHGVDHGPSWWSQYGWRPGQPPPLLPAKEAQTAARTLPRAVKVKLDKTPDEKLAELKAYAAKQTAAGGA